MANDQGVGFQVQGVPQNVCLQKKKAFCQNAVSLHEFSAAFHEICADRKLDLEFSICAILIKFGVDLVNLD